MPTATREAIHRAVRIPLASAMLETDITVPPHPRGVVIFAHECAEARREPEIRSAAKKFQEESMATILTNLLTRDEERIDAVKHDMRFDVALLAARLTSVIDWLAGEPHIGRLPVGLFAACTGASAALEAAARRPASVHAVVARGGRPDLADCLDLVRAPVLLVVGGADGAVLELNRQALHHLHGIRQLEVVPGATHKFEEAGAMEHVQQLAIDWFAKYVAGEEEEW